MRKRRKTRVRVVDERNGRMKADIWHDVDELAMFVSELELNDDDKNYILEGVGGLADFATALLDITEIPRGGIPYPFNPKKSN